MTDFFYEESDEWLVASGERKKRDKSVAQGRRVNRPRAEEDERDFLRREKTAAPRLYV